MEERIEGSLRTGPVTQLPTKYGIFTLHAFTDKENQVHLALVMGDIRGKAEVLTRIHSECLTGDTLFSLRCDCGEQLGHALHTIAKEGTGILLYMRQEGRGIGLWNKLRAYELQDKGFDTVQANAQLGFANDLRDYQLCATMLKALGVVSVRLLTNNPAKIDALQRAGVPALRESMPVNGHQYNQDYLKTKKAKMGHLLE